MNMKNIIFGLLAIAILIAGCVPTSVHPLYFKKDLIFVPELIGTWGNPDEEEGDKLIFEQADGNYYKMSFYESREESGEEASWASFEAHLIRLGDNFFLDVFPEEPESMNDFYKLHLVPTHSFMRVAVVGDTLKLGLFDYSWLENNLEDGKVDIKHETRDDLIVLTASTEALQKFVAKYAEVAFPYEKDNMLLRLY
jgi:hypothetical protein